ncbi:DUF1223 domain-containing protein [Pedobacter chinensis]|uniref:DUF1223 domain-containing protein n=1 Tax=Pedobacter chinensis TaxID=2282421 RepID=A0A369PW82_9SPHI|nr:DUF1223 domain-containing protein [Pedobacter chinensis]RDC54368.1 DUF1223 domain-containing protein [Pedobacter chinensis]
MKTPTKIALVNATIIAIIALTAFIWTGPKKKNIEQTINGKSFAVLELFTSEGCNSCPPAEQLLARIDKESNGKPVYVLGYHVDYFDNLGWKDVFGSPDNTRRQRKYSSWLNAQVYTPQLIINGSKEFVGGNEREIRNAIETQLLIKHTADLSFDIHRDGDLVKINYKTKDIQASDDLLLALVQKNGSTNVLRGENAGLQFSHVQIVRKMAQVSLKDTPSGSAELNIPKSIAAEQWEVIGMIQNRKTGAISAVNVVSVIQ